MAVHNFTINNLWGNSIEPEIIGQATEYYCRERGGIFTNKNIRNIASHMSIVAISASELVAVPSEKSNSVILGRVLTLELTVCQKALCLEFMF